MSLVRSIWDDITYIYRMGNMVKKIILLNVSVFLVVLLITIVCYAVYGDGGMIRTWQILEYFCIPANGWELLRHPWTIFTHFVLHQGFFHLLSNMMWFYLFGHIIGDLIGDRRVLPLYIMGGLAGGVVYFIGAQISPAMMGFHALGASAAVMSFGGAALLLGPEHRIRLFLWGEIKIKYIVLLMVLLDIIGTFGWYNAGGHVAHIGGFIMGMMYVLALRNGKDWADPINTAIDRITGWFSFAPSRGSSKRPMPKMKVTYRNPAPQRSQRKETNTPTLTHQERIDTILDKIKQKGFENLSQEEKDFLYEASKK